MLLNFLNVGQFVFENNELMKKLKSSLGPLTIYESQWKLGKIVPAMKANARRAALDFLLQIRSEHIEIISEHYNEEVEVCRVHHRAFEFLSEDMETIEDELNTEYEFDKLSGFDVTRKGNEVNVCIWR